MTGSRPALSAIVTAFNEEENIGACLDSLAFADEILMVDSFSMDRTREIARARPAVRVAEHPYVSPAAQKNWAIAQVRGPWVLILDADERVTPALQREIEQLLASGPARNAYRLRRRAFFLGEPIRFSGWRRDQVLRLFQLGHARYQDRFVHEEMDSDAPAGRLENPLDHHMVQSLEEYFHRTLRYASWGAAQAIREGRRTGPVRIFGRAVWRFVRTYLLQRGFLDGARGLIFCLVQAVGTFAKWSIVWARGVNAREGRPGRGLRRGWGTGFPEAGSATGDAGETRA